MIKRNLFKRCIANLLVVTMLFTSVRLETFANEKEQSTGVEQTLEQMEENPEDEYEIIKELVNERTENSNTYLLKSGAKKLVMFSDDVRYEDEDGEFVDYNPELSFLSRKGVESVKEVAEETDMIQTEKTTKYKYENIKGDSKQYLPSVVAEDTPILMEKDKYKVAFAPIQEKNENVFADDTFISSRMIIDTIENAYEESREGRTGVNYTNKDNSIKLSYESMSFGVKETIVLNEIPESNKFSFVLKTEGMEAKLDYTGNSISFIDRQGEEEQIVGGIDMPFMNDATEAAYSEDITYELEEISHGENQYHEYRFTMVVSEEYLSAPERAYPVKIDPTATWTGSSKVQDVYVLNSAASTNYYASGVNTFSVGKGTQGLFRTYMKIVGFGTAIDGKSVQSAKLTVYENGSNASGTVIQAKQVTETFDMGKITWSNRPANASKVYSSVTSSGTSGTAKTFDLTTWAKGMADGTLAKKGLALMASNESTASTYVKFYGSRTSSTTKRPKLVATYYDTPTTATSVTTDKTYLKSGDPLTVSWAGIGSDALSYVQYRVTNYDASTQKNTTNYISYSTSTKVGTGASGSNKIVSSLNWPEGQYNIYVRGVDKAGGVGTGKGKRLYVDKTAPTLSASITSSSSTSYGKVLPTVTWSASDTYLSQIQVSINGGSYTSIGTSTSGSKQLSGLKNSAANTINVRAVDKAGNYSSVRTLTYYYDSIIPVINSFSTDPITNASVYSKVIPSIKYSITDATLTRIAYSVNGSADVVIAGASSTGTKISSTGLKQGSNTIVLKAKDRAGAEVTKSIAYYYDSVAPVWGAIELTNSVENKYSKQLPILKWSGVTENNLKAIQYRINNGEYKTLGTALSGEATLPGGDLLYTGKYNIDVRIIDKADNVSAVKTFAYTYDYYASEISQYTPNDIHIRENVDGSTFITWNIDKKDIPNDVVYNVYRGDSPLFSEGEAVEVITSVKDNYAKTLSGKNSKTYYYKVKAVKVSNSGDVIEAGEFSNEVSSKTVTNEEIKLNLGIKSGYDTQEFLTPNGTGYTEKVDGNFIYKQTDFTLPASQLPINIVRTYNSRSSLRTTMGYGWSMSYDITVIKGQNNEVYYKQEGAIYKFELSGNSYVCKENTDISLIVDENGLYKITTKDNVVYCFDQQGRLNRLEDSNGTYTKLLYDIKLNVLTTIESYSSDNIVTKSVLFEYKETDQTMPLLTKVTSPDGMCMTYSYTDDRLTVATLTGTQGGKIVYKYEYNEQGKLVNIHDAEDNIYHLVYTNNKVIEMVYPNSDKYTMTYGVYNSNNLSETVVSKTNNEGNKIYSTKSVFDSNKRIVKFVDENERETGYEYNENGLITSITKKIIRYEVVNNAVVPKEEVAIYKTSYDLKGNIIEEISSDGSKEIYEYTTEDAKAANQPSKCIEYDVKGNKVAEVLYFYDESGNCTRTIDKTDNTASVSAYDSEGNEITNNDIELDKGIDLSSDERAGSITDVELKSGLLNNESVLEYDKDGNVISQNQLAGTTETSMTTTYDVCGRTLTGTDDKGRSVIYEYNEFGQVIKTVTEIENGKKEIEYTTYDANGTVKTETDSVGRVTSYVYDAINRVVEKTIKVDDDVRTYLTKYSYSDVEIFKAIDTTIMLRDAYVETETDQSGYVTSIKYADKSGNTVREKKNGLFVDYTYNSEGKVLTTFSAGYEEGNAVGGKLTVMLYDKNGNVIQEVANPSYNNVDNGYYITSKSIYTSNVYDINSNVIESCDGNGNVSKYEYDEQSRLKKVILIDGNNTIDNQRYEYDIQTKDSNGNIISTSDKTISALGLTSITEQNGAGQILSVTNASEDNTIKITTSYDYNEQGNKIKETFADESYKAYSYNLKNLVTQSMSYTSKGILTYKSAYQYDDENNLTKITDYKYEENQTSKVLRSTIYSYDKLARMIAFAEVDGIENPTEEQINAVKISYIYDDEDKIVEVDYPISDSKFKAIKIVYNSDRWLVGINAVLYVDGKMIETPLREYEYHNDGKVKNIRDYHDFLNQSEQYTNKYYEYDNFDRVISMCYSNSADQNTNEYYEYTYDNNSNILSERIYSNYEENEEGKIDESRIYKYDNWNRLLKSEITNRISLKTTTSEYNYDNVGNRISKTVGNISIKYTYNGVNQLISSTETTDGAITSKINYVYDANGNQIKEKDTIKNKVIENSYDTDSHLIKTQIFERDELKLTQINEYNGDGQRIRKTENNNLTNYYYLDGQVLYTTDDNGVKTSQNILGISDNTIATIRFKESANGNLEEKSYFYNKDIKSSTINVIDNAGKSVVSYKYDDYGSTSCYGQKDFYNEICYTGGIYDASTGLYYLNARYYEPKTGRFLTQDTYRGESNDDGIWNLYTYCRNNPISYVDPSGHFAIAIPLGYATFEIVKAAAIYTTAAIVTAAVAYEGYRVGSRYGGTGRSNTRSGATKKSFAIERKIALAATLTLADVKARKQNSKKKYYLAIVNTKTNDLQRIGMKMSFKGALLALGFTGATNSIKKRLTHSKGAMAPKPREYKESNEKKDKADAVVWGIYTSNKRDAKSLAVVTGSNAKPEVHGDGYYGHYHDRYHMIHIWYGSKANYIFR